MGNDDSGATLHQAFKRLLNKHFSLGVNCASGFVKNKNTRIGQNGAGNADQLTLTLRKLRPTFATDGVIAIFLLQNKVVGVGKSGGGDHLIHAGIRAGITDVIGDGIGKDKWILQHYPDMLTQWTLLHRSDVDVIDQNTPSSHIVKAANKAGDGGFAAAGLPNQGHHLAGGDM